MRFKVISCVVIVAAAVLLGGCVKKEKGVTAVMVGGTSLLIDTIRALVPDAAGDSLAIVRAARRITLSKTLSGGEKPPGPAAEKLARKLTLLSGSDYSAASAELLLEASTRVALMVRGAKNIHDVIALLDSVLPAEEVDVGGTSPACRLTDRERGILEGLSIGTAKDLGKLFEVLFDISSDAAATIVSFVNQKDIDGSEGVKAMIKGLIADTAPAPASAAVVRKKAVNPLLALKFRPQESIRDSIAKHLSNLQQMYKRHLKTGDVASGTVWVTFLVDCEGRVVDARILKSEIADRQFLERLSQYLRIIKFKPVPESAGRMTFEFPFEFKAEEL
jgi:TonB family protein